MRSLAAQRSGRCISKRYFNSGIRLQWQCSRGHEWKAFPANVIRGSWCPHCAGVKRLTLREMQVLAGHQGGECLSKRYVNNATKLRWRCAGGHEWEAAPAPVKKGQWCPYCARVARLTLQELLAIAAQRGGECLSPEYINTSRHLRWKCARGHQWDAIPASVKKGSWCPHCVHNHQLRLQEMQQIARDRGGSCISKRYTNNETALLWECRRGHRWKATPSNVKRGLRKRGTWCLRCYNLRRVFRSRDSIEKMRDLASNRGGKCLSREYVNSKTRLEWECAEGHRWWTAPVTVGGGSWCPVCAHTQRLTLAEFRTLAASRGGKCLSRKYKNKETKLRWQCVTGHRWFAKAGNVKRGAWCRRCANNQRRNRWNHSQQVPLEFKVPTTTKTGAA
jgi:glutaredoxin